MKVLVCGGRDFSDYNFLVKILDQFHKSIGPFTEVIHGGARGADTLAGLWANLNSIVCTVYPADWDAHGRSAGSIRNAEMLEKGKPDFVIAFPGGRGTQDMISKTYKAGIGFVEVSKHGRP